MHEVLAVCYAVRAGTVFVVNECACWDDKEQLGHNIMRHEAGAM